MYDTYNYESSDTKKKKLTIIAIVLGAAALLAVTVLVIMTVTKRDNQKTTAETYNLADVQDAANIYANFILNGKKNDKSEITDIQERNGEMALEKNLNEDAGSSARKDFMKTAKKLNSDLRKKLKYVDKGQLEKADEYESMIEDVGVEVGMINEFLDTDFEVDSYFEQYKKDAEDGVSKKLQKNYKDVLLYHNLVNLMDENPKEGEEYIEYSEIATDTEKIMAAFYEALIDYGVGITDTYDAYKEKDCLGTKGIRSTCRDIVDKSTVGEYIAEDRSTAMSEMVKRVDEAKTDAIFVVQDIAQKIGK